MEHADTQPAEEQQNDEHDQELTVKRPYIRSFGATGTLKRGAAETLYKIQTVDEYENMPIEARDTAKLANSAKEEPVDTPGRPAETDAAEKESDPDPPIEKRETIDLPAISENEPGEPMVTNETQVAAEQDAPSAIPTDKLPMPLKAESAVPVRRAPPKKYELTRGNVLLLMALLLMLVFHAAASGSEQFIGQKGWGYVLGGPINSSDPNLLKELAQQLRHPKPGSTAQPTHITPREYIDLIVKNMTLEQKLGQMMIVQFTGPDYGLEISTMISQYNVGAVLIFSANDNIHDKNQLRSLIAQMQSNSTAIPLAVAIDQEGGRVDRLVNLDGPRPSATSIGETHDPNKAMAEGRQDASDLAYYGFNLNLAPVVDVTNVDNSQLYLRTFGNDATSVTKMAEAYLRGLQQSGHVLGTLKHFPGLGDVSADPHNDVPYLERARSQLEAIDWAPYRSMIRQGNVSAIMVTHEIVTQIDNTKPSSLSYKIVTGILRNELGFQGVVITDSLTMEGITAYYTEAQAAVLAIEAGDDLLMGATSASDVGRMIDGIKQAISNGEISEQRIDDSVRRILMMKYEMGLIHF